MPDHVAADLANAAVLLAVGMTVVFLFLTLLMLAVQLLARFAPPEPEPLATAPKSTAEVGLSAAQVAAIGAAVHRYRQQYPPQ